MGGIDKIALMCHAPIVLPEVAGPEGGRVSASTKAMDSAGRWLAESRPDVVVVISPHTPRLRNAFGVNVGERLYGSFADFGTAGVSVSLPTHQKFAASFIHEALGQHLAVKELKTGPLDHGALVPLHFLYKNGWRGPTVVVAFPHSPRLSQCFAFGRCLEATAERLNLKVALVASGDMSHRLTPDAPAGYNPQAQRFDKLICDLVRGGDYQKFVDLPDEVALLREDAAEDVIDSLAVAAGASGLKSRGQQFLSYEGPFGVGYLVARLFDAEARDDKNERATDDDIANANNENNNPEKQKLIHVARAAVENYVLEGKKPEMRNPQDVDDDPNVALECQEVTGVFVTIWRNEGGKYELRGCIGRFERIYKSLTREVYDLAVQAAIYDPRFTPVEKHEPPHLKYEVSLLHSPEPIHDVAQLDPKRYGVIVTDGPRSATLLPGIEGIETVEQQLRLVKRKAGIPEWAQVKIERYTVEKIV